MKLSVRIAALFLAAILLLAGTGIPSARAEEKVRRYSGWEYIIKDGEITLQRYTGDVTGLMIPAGINKYPVTALGESALKKNSSLKYVTVPENIRTIGRWAFSDCTSLVKVTFKEGSQLETIGDGAFMGCTALGKITLPASLSSLGLFVFNGCTALSNIFVEQGNDSFKSKEGVVFSRDGTALYAFPPARTEAYTVPKTVKTIRGGAFNASALSSIRLPSALEAIDVLAFSGCKALQVVKLPNGLLSIGMQAFSGCILLTGMTIPASVTAIGEGAFMGCSRMTELQAALDSPYYITRDKLLLTADGMELVAFTPGQKAKVDVPEGVVHVRMFAFAGSKGLLSVKLPSSCLTVGAAAFTECENLRSVAILNPQAQLERGIFNKDATLTLYGYAASTAADYARDYGISFEALPEPTPAPTKKPTKAPTTVPTEAPTEVPTSVPTEPPTAVPAETPAEVPTAVPTETPTAVPAETPAEVPTEVPTAAPTEAPTASPTPAPTPTVLPKAEETASPSPTPAPSPALTGPGKLTVVTESFFVYPYSDYFRGKLSALVQNTGGKPVQFSSGLLEVYGPGGDVISSGDVYDCYPLVLAPGETGYLTSYIYVEDAKTSGDIADYSLTIMGHGDISADITQYPVKAEYREVKDNGSEAEDYVVLTIENNTDALVSNLNIALALADTDGKLLFTYAEQFSIYSISAYSTIEYRVRLNSYFTAWRQEQGFMPGAVQAVAFSMAYR